MEFVGPGVSKLSADFRIGIDVMTTETTCLSSIWKTDDKIKEFYDIHGRSEDYKELNPGDVAYYDGMVYVNLSEIKPMIAMPFHPSNVYTIDEVRTSLKDILHDVEQKALVSTYQILLDAEAEWARLEEENNFTEDDMELAARVDELIAAIGTVTEDSQEAIATARNAYDSLTDKQKTLVAHPEILQQAEETYNQLKASAVASAIAGIGEVTLDKKELIFGIQDQYCLLYTSDAADE